MTLKISPLSLETRPIVKAIKMMHSVAGLEVPKLPNDIDGLKIQPALDDVTGWMHISKNNARPLILPWLDDFEWYPISSDQSIDNLFLQPGPSRSSYDKTSYTVLGIEYC